MEGSLSAWPGLSLSQMRLLGVPLGCLRLLSLSFPSFFSVEILSFLSPCPLTFPLNTEMTPGIKRKNASNIKQRLEIERHPSRSQEIPETRFSWQGDFKLHILQSGSAVALFGVAASDRGRLWHRVPLGPRARLRLHAGCTGISPEICKRIVYNVVRASLPQEPTRHSDSGCSGLWGSKGGCPSSLGCTRLPGPLWSPPSLKGGYSSQSPS